MWHVASANELGHDRRADRGANMLLAYDERAIDVVTVGADATIDELARTMLTHRVHDRIDLGRLRWIRGGDTAAHDE